MKKLLLFSLLLVTWCVDRRFEFDRCFSTEEKAWSYCDASADCQGVYGKDR